jgi:drug/metabolite transporter (DMT)-like permease
MAGGLGIMSYCLSSWLNFEGLKYVSAQLERLILYIYPTMVAACWPGFFLKDRITARHVVALVLAYLGVAILFGAEIDHQGPNAWLGGGLIFAGALIYAVYVTASKPIITKHGFNPVHGLRHVGRLDRRSSRRAESTWRSIRRRRSRRTATGWRSTLAIFCTVIPSLS